MGIATLVFFVVNFGLMFLAATPMVFTVTTAAVTIHLLFGNLVNFGIDKMAQAFVAGAAGTNTGLTIILFMLAGDVMSQGKLTHKIFNIFAYFLGKKRGFMPILSIVTCMFYGAISGSGPATTAAVAAMCYPVLVGLGYDKLFSAAILVSAGSLGMVIPPSLPVTGVAALTNGLDLIVLYKMAAIAGVAAGLMIILYTYFYCRRKGNGDQLKINAWVNALRERGLSKVAKESIWAILTPVIILGSIFSGIADTAQAAAIALVYAIIVSVFVYKSITLADIIPLCKKTLSAGAPMLLMLSMATVFSNVLNALKINDTLTAIVQNANITPVVIMIVILLYQLVMGAIGAGSGVTVVIPLAFPLMMAAGIEPFTACTAVVLMQAVGLVTPPIGLCLFVMTGMAKCDITDLVKPLLPYILIMTAVALFLVLFPGVFTSITAGGFIPTP